MPPVPKPSTGRGLSSDGQMRGRQGVERGGQTEAGSQLLRLCVAGITVMEMLGFKQQPPGASPAICGR